MDISPLHCTRKSLFISQYKALLIYVTYNTISQHFERKIAFYLKFFNQNKTPSFLQKQKCKKKVCKFVTICFWKGLLLQGWKLNGFIKVKEIFRTLKPSFCSLYGDSIPTGYLPCIVLLTFTSLNLTKCKYELYIFVLKCCGPFPFWGILSK